MQSVPTGLNILLLKEVSPAPLPVGNGAVSYTNTLMNGGGSMSLRVMEILTALQHAKVLDQ